MSTDWLAAAEEVFIAIQKLETLDIQGSMRESATPQDRVQNLAHQILLKYNDQIQKRTWEEFFGWGPLAPLLLDENITEILVNGPEQIWFETQGQLEKYPDKFFSDNTFDNCIQRICQKAGVFATQEMPFCEGSWGHFRLSLIRDNVTKASCHFSLRRHPVLSWTIDRLLSRNWCSDQEATILRALIERRKNFLVIGSTGSGKTSVLNSLLALIPENERAILIEDTSELRCPNSASMKLVTRDDPQKVLPEINQTELLKRSLRLRPDRMVLGEIRGSEAKDFLMALATGHSGSFGSLHAHSAQQALLRLEMLIQMGSPQWNLLSIRRLIQLSLEYIVVVNKDRTGHRKFGGLFRLHSLEEQGFLVDQIQEISSL